MNTPTVKVLIAKANDINKNNRMYPLEELQKAVNEYNSRNDEVGCCFVTVDDDLGLEINLAKIVAMVKKLYFENNDLYAEIVPIETPMKGMIWEEDGMRKGINVRFIGTGFIDIKEEGHAVVRDLYINHFNAYLPGTSVSWAENE